MNTEEGTLIASVSGIRGIVGRGLDPDVLVAYAGAYGTWCRQQSAAETPVVVVGRDARMSGAVCADIVMATLQSTGCTVIDAGLAPTPTVEMAVLLEEADGGIILSASHNPPEWNALKLLDEAGEFLSAEAGEAIKRRAESGAIEYVPADALGERRTGTYVSAHIDHILDLDLITPETIAAQDFSVVVDGINSVGGTAIPQLLQRLGVREANITVLNGEPTGRFAHPAEPLPEHLTGLTAAVADREADLGLAVDPDADRLALVDSAGRYVSEELTQVIAADFVWRHREGPFVTNLSSSRAIDDVATRHDQRVYRSAVGEAHVVQTMKDVDAVLGGEGNGGVILPELHYGRDALVGAALVLQHLADEERSLADVHDDMPHYAIVKEKLPLDGLDADRLLKEVAERYADHELSTIDGLKIDFEQSWVHLRTSNTEPVLRIYAEAPSAAAAEKLATKFKGELAETAR